MLKCTRPRPGSQPADSRAMGARGRSARSHIFPNVTRHAGCDPSLMATQAKHHDADKDDNDAASIGPTMTDPVTGAQGVGPITRGSARGGGWGLAARWFMLAILIMA